MYFLISRERLFGNSSGLTRSIASNQMDSSGISYGSSDHNAAGSWRDLETDLAFVHDNNVLIRSPEAPGIA